MLTAEQTQLQRCDVLRSLASSLRAMIEPEFGLLDELLSQDALDQEHYDIIRCGTVTVYQRNDKLLQYLTRNDVDLTELIGALQRTDQQHVVNFIQHHTGTIIESNDRYRRYCNIYST